MEKHVTFIIGSGFSIHAGFPTTSQINKRLTSTIESDFVYSAMEAYYLNGESYPNNAFESLLQRKYFIAFKDFYINEVVGGKDKFHYEDFYDFSMKGLKESWALEYVNFICKFKNDHITIIPDYVSIFDLIDHVYFILQGLVANLIKSVKLERSHLIFGRNSNLFNFSELINYFSNDHIIHIASLNHDCYMERLNISDVFHGDLEDGFEESGSTYYGELDVGQKKINLSPSSYKVRLPRFTNKFGGKYRLYKLHGGIDQYWYRYNNDEELIKSKHWVQRFQIYKEFYDGQNYLYQNNILPPTPNFLTGTNSKIYRYGTNYFKQLFDRFNDAMTKSEVIVIIGYGFKDSEINKCISDFLHSTSTKIFVIDIVNQIPKTMQSKNIYYFYGGVEYFDHNRIIGSINTAN